LNDLNAYDEAIVFNSRVSQKANWNSSFEIEQTVKKEINKHE